MLVNLFILLVRTVMDRYRPPSRGGLVLSGSVPFVTVPGQFTPEPEQFQNCSGPNSPGLEPFWLWCKLSWIEDARSVW